MKKYIILSMLVVLCSCTYGAMSSDEITAVEATCSNVDQKIAMLQKEKADNNYREAAGVGNFVPMTAMFRFVTGRYDTNAKIATGEWARMIDGKLAEMQQFKRECEM